MAQIQIIVLAAGHGKRMNNNYMPKVLIPFFGKALVQHLIEAIKESGVCHQLAIVVGQEAEMVKQVLGPNYTYVLQAEQLGTGHAVTCTREALKGKADDIMVLYGDHPLVTAAMITNLTQVHLDQGRVLTMGTVKVSDFDGWRESFTNFGRIIRDDQGKVCEIVEVKDATEGQKEIKELNPSYFCFKADWLWQNLDNLKNNNAQQEYYLTDLVGLACSQGQEIATVEIEPKEALGVNTAEQLELIKQIV